MKKLNLLVLIGLLACTNLFAEEVIVIAASAVPHAEILKQVKPILKKDGIELKIKEFDDYIQPNLLVKQKLVDANFFQHRPYLKEFNTQRKTNLVELVAVHIEPMGLYASNNPKLADFTKTKKLANLPKDLIVGVPNDITNEGRALELLEKKGLVKIKAGITYATKKDIESNPYNLQIKELDPAMLPRTLQAKQLDLAIINSNFAIQAKLNPAKDAIFIEDASSPYVNIVAVREDNLNNDTIKKLKLAMHNKVVKDFIKKNYKGSIIPAF